MPNAPLRRPARSRRNLGPSQRLLGIFALFILLPGAFLAVFALRVLRQEGQIARQRAREDLERTAAEIGRDLDSEFRRWTESLRPFSSLDKPFDVGLLPEPIGGALSVPGGGAILRGSEEEPVAYPPEALLYALPGSAPDRLPEARLPARFAAAEAIELGRKNFPEAIRAYRDLLASADSASRPLVLQRLARTYRKAGRFEEAGRTYRELLDSDGTWIGGLPSDLIARAELCSLAAENGGPGASPQTALDFYRDLVAGAWLLSKPRYLYYSEAARTWCRDLGAEPVPFEELRANEERKLGLSLAAEDYLAGPRAALPGGARPYLALRLPEDFTAIVLSAEFLGSEWWPRFLAGRGVALDASLVSADGSLVFGVPPAEEPPFVVTGDFQTDETRWLLRLWPVRPESIQADIRQRQALFVGIIGLVTILLVFGGYLTVRLVKRELEIARLRADFVSTVSHEFRSPLTGIRQLGGMLLDGRVPDPAKQRDYYRMIVQESDRLTRLVENVLDFSRMEEGRREYRFETLDTSPWLRSLAADFAAEAAAGAVSVEAAIPDRLPPISADKEALGSAVHNLLDNAAKYSTGRKAVWISAAAGDTEITIAVRDEGIGISEEDQKHIFDRFFRAGGETSKRVKGAGLGLSLVKHVVAAHGGTVECRSRPGEGSTFTIRIPGMPARRGG
jgi:signal transduction histidine kinase